MNKATLSKILSIVLTAVLALAAVFGYNVAIVQPQLAALQKQIAAVPPQFGTRGITHYSELSAANITATDDLTVGDAASITGALSAASVNSSGPITGTTGAFSGAVSTGALSPASVTVTTTLNIGDPLPGGTSWIQVNKNGNINLASTQAVFLGDYDAGGINPAYVRADSNTGTVTVAGALWAEKLAYEAKTASTYTENGKWYSNLGATGPITLTLWDNSGAGSGKRTCFYVAAAQTMYIDPPLTEQILALTNAGGDQISSATVGSSVCLMQLTASSWGATSLSGTWADAN